MRWIVSRIGRMLPISACGEENGRVSLILRLKSFRAKKRGGRPQGCPLSPGGLKRRALAEAAGDVFFSQLMLRIGKDLSGFSHLDEVAQMEEGGSL